jgi:hypothetical protein
MFSRQQHLLKYNVSRKFVLASIFKAIRHILSAPESKLELTPYISPEGSLRVQMNVTFWGVVGLFIS